MGAHAQPRAFDLNPSGRGCYRARAVESASGLCRAYSRADAAGRPLLAGAVRLCGDGRKPSWRRLALCRAQSGAGPSCDAGGGLAMVELSMALRRAETIRRPLGDAAFVKKLKRQSGRNLRPVKRGPKPQQAGEPER